MARERHNNSHNDRNGTILNLLRKNRSVKISELQEVLGVSDMTIRRCLNEMAAEGMVKRVHGGATIIDPWEKELAFQSRVADNLETKMALAERVQPFIPDGGSIYLDGGTTTFEVAKQLSLSGKKCTVITDSIAIMRELLGKTQIDSNLLGGKLSSDGNTVDGPLTIDNAGLMSVDLCIFSCDGFNERCIQNQSLTGSQTKKVMMNRASLAICVTVSTKYGKNRCFHFCDWKDVDIFVTDSNLFTSVREEIEAQGVEVQPVDVPGRQNRGGEGLVRISLRVQGQCTKIIRLRETALR